MRGSHSTARTTTQNNNQAVGTFILIIVIPALKLESDSGVSKLMVLRFYNTCKTIIVFAQSSTLKGPR